MSIGKLIIEEGSDFFHGYLILPDQDHGDKQINVAYISTKIVENNPEALEQFKKLCEDNVPAALAIENKGMLSPMSDWMETKVRN